jgi:DNA-binding beta-propeller fold protein YncE
MYSRPLVLVALLFVCGGIAGATSIPTPPESRAASARIVVANRGSGTISVIDANAHVVIGTYPLPSGPNPPEPMYPVHSRGRVFVGDRANSRVVAFDAATFDVIGTVATGAGVFHMWINPDTGRLWVNNDIDKTASLVDSVSLTPVTTVPMPADLIALGGKPHDVIFDPRGGRYAYVSMITVTGPNDYVVKFDLLTYQEVGRAAVGKDPHISATRHNLLLYVPCQNSNVVMILNRVTMDHELDIPIPGAHGAGMAPNGRRFYTTNITSTGPAGISTINTLTNSQLGAAVDTPYGTPHNIVFTPNGQKFFLTHSGAASNKVTVYTIGIDSLPDYLDEVTVEFNPFGLTYVP